MCVEKGSYKMKSGFRKSNSTNTELLYMPASIGCKEVCMLKEEQKKLIDNKAAVEYEYGGYQIRVHFSGEKTLAQCVKNLTERKSIC